MKHINRRNFLTVTCSVPFIFTVCKRTPKIKMFETPTIDAFDPWLEINLTDMRWNLAQVRQRVENRPIMAVLKANAYGHGLVNVAQFLEKQNIRHIAVGKVNEGVDLRVNAIKSTILNFGPFSRQEAETIVRYNISQSVYSETVDFLAEAARRLKKQARVHIKIDTGLGRVGIPYYQALPFIEKVAAMPDITIEGVFTTLTEEKDFDNVQLERFLQVCDEAAKKGIPIGIRHAASSAAVANFPPSFLDMVRPGDALYGLEPLPNLVLKQVMTLKTKVIYVKNLRPGDSVSYHRAFTADKETAVATLPMGYSDGYPPQVIGKGEVMIQGHRLPLIAAVTANHTTVNVTNAEGIKIGDEVVLFGSFENKSASGGQDKNTITLEEVAAWANSSVYKIAIGMNPLMRRIYVED